MRWLWWPLVALAAVRGTLLSLALSSGHDASAGAPTPVRYLVSGAPMLMLFLGDAALRWGSRRIFVVSATVLALVSLETAVAYNWNHSRDVAPLVTNGFAGLCRF